MLDVSFDVSASFSLRLGAPAELRSIASALAPTLYLSDPEILAEFRQDVPWIPTDFMDSKDARCFAGLMAADFLHLPAAFL